MIYSRRDGVFLRLTFTNVIGDSEEVTRVLDIIKVSGSGLGLELNIKKTKIFWPSCNGMKLREGLFTVNIQRPSSGVKLLGGAVSRDTNSISGLTMRRVANAVDLMNLQWRLASLPIRFGGLGLYSAKVVSSYDFVALRVQSWVLQDHILRDSGICDMYDYYIYALACLRDTIPSFDFSGFTNKDTAPSKAQQTLANVLFSEMVKDMEVHFDVTMRQKAAFECLRSPHAQDFLLAIPIDRHVWIPLGNMRFIVKTSHDSSANTIWLGTSFLIKHEKTCIENQHVFIPFAFDTFGFLAPKAMELLSQVQRVMHRNVDTRMWFLNVLALQSKKG
ncbi:hypothetical protein Tco_0369069 [Tanacetum coccineum]